MSGVHVNSIGAVPANTLDPGEPPLISRRASWIIIVLFGMSLVLNVVSLGPLLANENLGWQYQRTLAIWAAHFRRPSIVFLGDSLTAGGRSFGRLDSINLGSSGLTTALISGGFPQAAGYNPHHIVIMAGTNDAESGQLDEGRIRTAWRRMLGDRRVVVVLATPTRDAVINARIERANAIAGEMAARAGRQVISLPELRGPDGLLKPEFSIDGTHLKATAYRFWRARLP